MESRYYDPEIETASRDELRSWQERKLKAIVQHACIAPFIKNVSRRRISPRIKSAHWMI